MHLDCHGGIDSVLPLALTEVAGRGPGAPPPDGARRGHRAAAPLLRLEPLAAQETGACLQRHGHACAVLRRRAVRAHRAVNQR